VRVISGLLAHQARYELIAFLRNRQARFSTLILPPALLVLFVSGFDAGGDRLAAATQRVPGIAALGVLVACFANLVVSVTAQRESGVLERRRATPAPAAVLIGGRALIAVLAALASTAAVCFLGVLAYGVHVAAAAVPALAAVTIAGALALATLAHALSTAIRSTDAAQPVVQAISLPLYVVSGVFVPLGDLPAWLHDAGTLFPLERLVDGLHRAAAGAMPWSDLAVLTVWAIAGAAVAVRRFTWTPAGPDA
jgi:ABC-2 type transport system permease protein